jgi:sec-independent protein translocase protein TatC
VRILPRRRGVATVGRRRPRIRPRRPEERSDMSLLEHLEELRGRLFWIFGSVAAAAIAGWFAFDRVVELLLEPARPYLKDLTDGKLVFTGPLEAFTLRFKVAFYIGFLLAFPIVLFHVWRFISPGLHRNERKWAFPFIGSGIVLFGGGVLFAWFTMPQALRWLIGPEITGTNVEPLLGAKSYLDFALLYHIAFGLAFELPVVLMLLAMMRVVTSKQMAKHRRHVFLGIALGSAVLTPSVDWFTMLALTVAMYLLFEMCIWVSRLLRR